MTIKPVSVSPKHLLFHLCFSYRPRRYVCFAVSAHSRMCAREFCIRIFQTNIFLTCESMEKQRNTRNDAGCRRNTSETQVKQVCNTRSMRVRARTLSYPSFL